MNHLQQLNFENKLTFLAIDFTSVQGCQSRLKTGGDMGPGLKTGAVMGPV